MTFLMEVIHTVSPATKTNFANYAATYSEVAVPLMQESGYDIFGAWEFLTGQLGRDLLLVRCESMEHFEQASARIAQKISTGRVARLQSLGLNIEEDVQYGYPLAYGVGPRRIDSDSEASGHCLCVRVELARANFAAALEASKNAVRSHIQLESPYELAFAYGASSGRRGSYTEIWTSRHAGEMTPKAPFSPHADNETLLKLVDSLTLEVIRPLPYSKTQ